MSFIKRMIPLVLAFLCASQVLAYTPENLEVKAGDTPTRGKASNIRGQFVLRNTTGAVLVVNYQHEKNSKYAFKVRPARFTLKPKQSVRIRYEGAIRASGKFQVMFNFDLKTRDGKNAGRFEYPQYFKVRKGAYRLSDYKSLYMKHRRQSEELGKYFVENKYKRSIPMAKKEYKTKRPSVGEMLKLDRRSIYKIPTKSGLKDPRIIVRPQPRPRPRPRPLPPIGGRLDDIIPEANKNNYTEALPLRSVEKANHRLKGRFSYKGMDGQLHPAFGWRVQALRKGFFGSWSVQASDWVEFDGSWRLNVSRGGDYRLRYVAANRFFSPMDEDENIYRWIGPVRRNIGRSHNEGHRYADLDEADVRGLGEVYREGMILWSKLYWDGDINPIRDKTIKFYYPNTKQTCSDTRTTPWSCASVSGKIWLIPSHASRFGVTTHELSHQINYEFWDNKRAKGSGGSHNLVNCFTEGLALTEGFANFMVFWAHQNRAGAPDSGFDFNGESPAGHFCTNPLASNESWVAAAFWDLHDTRTDGDDRLWFIHEGAVPAIFLRNGVENSMKDFHSIYRNRANNNHTHHIDNIFQQNNVTH